MMSKNMPLKTGQKKNRLLLIISRYWDMYLLLFPVLLYFALFRYWPMYGIQIAFKDYSPYLGFLKSPWVGLEHFLRYFRSYYFVRLITNTIGISLYQLAVGFPIPIILALSLNEVRNRYFKKTVQMVTYIPHFLSVVVLVGMVFSFLSPRGGIINQFAQWLFKCEPVYFMSEPKYFKTIYVLSGVWQHMGWGTIIYIAALSGIDPELYEAAIVDGASKIKRILHITIPGILPTAVILLILDCGRIMNVGFEKVFLMQNGQNIAASEVISTYVYKTGILGAQFSFSAAIGLFNSVVNVILLLIVNSIAKRMSEVSLW